MIYNVQFTYEGMEYNYALDTDELDRNFEDESTAYWLIHPLFEINIYRNEDTGELTTEGYVKPYATEDDFENDWFDFDGLIPVRFIPA